MSLISPRITRLIPQILLCQVFPCLLASVSALAFRPACVALALSTVDSTVHDLDSTPFLAPAYWTDVIPLSLPDPELSCVTTLLALLGTWNHAIFVLQQPSIASVAPFPYLHSFTWLLRTFVTSPSHILPNIFFLWGCPDLPKGPSAPQPLFYLWASRYHIPLARNFLSSFSGPKSTKFFTIQLTSHLLCEASPADASLFLSNI